MPMFLEGLCISWGLVNGLQWRGCGLPLKGVLCNPLRSTVVWLACCPVTWRSYFPTGSPNTLTLIAMKKKHYVVPELGSQANLDLWV